MTVNDVKVFLAEKNVTDVTTLTLDDILDYIHRGTMVRSTEETAIIDAIDELVECFYHDEIEGCYEALKTNGFNNFNLDVVDGKLLDIRMATIKLSLAIGHEIAKRGHTIVSIAVTDEFEQDGESDEE